MNRARIIFLIASLAAMDARAGAWTQPSGYGQLIVNNFYYSAGTYFDEAGKKQTQKRYRKWELNPYIEYGLTENYTIGANLSAQYLQQDDVAGEYKYYSYGIGDSELFIRRKIWDKDGLAVSVEPMVKLPTPASTKRLPQLGSDFYDAGISVAAGYGFNYRTRPHFVEASLGYRKRFGDAQDQIKLAGTAGFSITNQWTVMPQIFITQRVKKPDILRFSQSSADDYNLIKAQFSTVYLLSDNTAVQMGVFSNIDGKNTGAGEGVIMSLWKVF